MSWPSTNVMMLFWPADTAGFTLQAMPSLTLPVTRLDVTDKRPSLGRCAAWAGTSRCVVRNQTEGPAVRPYPVLPAERAAAHLAVKRPAFAASPFFAILRHVWKK